MSDLEKIDTEKEGSDSGNEGDEYEMKGTTRIDVDTIERVAEYYYRSGFFPEMTKDQIISLMFKNLAEGRSPFLAPWEYSILDGRPVMRAESMLSRFIDAGGKVVWHEYTHERVRATFTHPSVEKLDIEWTLKDAERAGLLKKVGEDSPWLKYPRAMLRARLISEAIRTVYPTAVLSVYTPEETYEIIEERKSKPNREESSTSKQKERIPETVAKPELLQYDVKERAEAKEKAIKTRALLEAIGSLSKELNLNKEELRKLAQEIAGRKVESAKDLTLEELEKLQEMLQGITRGPGIDSPKWESDF